MLLGTYKVLAGFCAGVGPGQIGWDQVQVLKLLSTGQNNSPQRHRDTENENLILEIIRKFFCISTVSLTCDLYTSQDSK